MKIIWRSLTKAALLLAIGAAAFYALEATDDLLFSSLGWPVDTPAGDALPEVAIPPDSPKPPRERKGNLWLTRAVARLEQRQSIAAKIKQVGWVNGELVETFGEYRQLASGDRQRFMFTLQGQLAGRPAQLLRVSDGRYLWTDLHWRAEEDSTDRTITRVDLRRVQRSASAAAQPTPEPGRAVAEMVEPGDWSRFGGLPMLLAALNENFDFGAGRAMQLREQEVIAMVGRWNPGKVESLFGATVDSTMTSLPDRAPRLVVVALDRQTLFPKLVEYRAKGDPQATDRKSDEALLSASRRPMLKIDLLEPVFDAPLSKEQFAYAPPPGIDWTDQTTRHLSIAQSRQKREKIAKSPSSAPRR